MATRLLLVRHGETTYNASGVVSGQADVPLTGPGDCQVAALARRLADRRIDHVVSSPLARAVATAEAIAAPHGLGVRLDDDLRELGMGAWEGRTPREIRAREPATFDAWRARPDRVVPEGGESVAALADRAMRAAENLPPGTVVWSTHGGFIGVLLCRLLGVPQHRRSQLHTDNASVSEVYFDGKYPVLRALNATEHLADLLPDHHRPVYASP
ncbi:histidine phosphatase family protein [Amycolatopsis albispora]|uniref:Phosphoglycerate kinase n=1 Tax=Amycolatopsis albispora TaxID=1804986 RepID=A0A344L9P3_9PSEU|nr:histidine phosphatase family protein [Amycolatopsis albispora]AXB44767.1 hypothetical protein A4R43_21565 [Amycolatopsis albispora]